MKITIINANVIASTAQADGVDLYLSAEKIQFADGGDEYTLEEIRTVMRSRRWRHTRKLDQSPDNTTP